MLPFDSAQGTPSSAQGTVLRGSLSGAEMNRTFAITSIVTNSEDEDEYRSEDGTEYE